MWLVWLLLGVFLGFMAAALVVAAGRGDLAAEVQRLRALEDGARRLELKVRSPGFGGDVFRARLHDLVTMWSWAADDGRMVIAEALDPASVVFVDEIGDPIT